MIGYWLIPMITWLVVVAAGAVYTFGPHHHKPEPHHPDYAKIARLEVELGIVDPPEPPPPPGPVNPTITDARTRPPSIPAPMVSKPDHLCSLCIPGRPSTRCPFNSVCQT